MSPVTNYNYIAGAALGTLETIAGDLCLKNFVSFDKYDELKAFFAAEIARIKSAEADYSKGD